MNELSLQGKIYVVCQAIYFIMIAYGLYEIRLIRKELSQANNERVK